MHNPWLHNRLLLLVLSLPLAASGSQTDDLGTAAGTIKPPTKTKTLRPSRERTFVPGPPLTPSTELLAWLEGLPSGVRVRLPVVIGFTDDLGLFSRDAFLAASPKDLSENSIQVWLDDTAMGIPLADHLRRYRLEGATERAIWLEGNWGAVITASIPPPPKDESSAAKEKRYPFSVRRVLDPVAGKPAGKVLVERRGPQPGP